MQIIITGGGGFLGQRLASALLAGGIAFDELLLVDIIQPTNPGNDKRVRCLQADLSEAGVSESIVTSETGIIYHLAAIVSSHAESDFDLGWKINLDVTRNLLEACRQQKTAIRLVFSSSLAVFGGELPAVVNDGTAVTPRSSYGTQKAMGELLVNDYSRKGFVDGVVVRLPTVCVRPGRPNQAASSFVSSIIREPLNGEEAICPVSTDLSLWLASPGTIIKNLVHAGAIDASKLEGWRTINLPGISVTVQQMLDALKKATDDKTLALVKFEKNEGVNRIVSSWPGTLDNTKGLKLGFKADSNFEDFITEFRATK